MGHTYGTKCIIWLLILFNKPKPQDQGASDTCYRSGSNALLVPLTQLMGTII